MSLGVLGERVSNLKSDLDTKHTQNRRDIHLLRNSVEELNQQIWLLKVKIAGYSSAAGILTAVFIKLLDHIWK